VVLAEVKNENSNEQRTFKVCKYMCYRIRLVPLCNNATFFGVVRHTTVCNKKLLCTWKDVKIKIWFRNYSGVF
jgi:hypothetical protein